MRDPWTGRLIVDVDEERLSTRVLRYLARGISTCYLALFVFMSIASLMGDWQEGWTSPELTFREGLGFLFAGIFFLGYSLAWKWEVLGGVLGIVATVAFRAAIDVPAVMLLIMVIPGFLYLSSAALSGAGAGRDRTAPEGSDS